MYGVSKMNEKNSSVFVENSEEKLGIGSGIILTSNGFILSNFETTGEEGESCFVTLKNGKTYPAIVKWVDKNLDISIIKIAIENLLYLEMGNSNNIFIGDKFYMLSNSTGYDFDESLKEVLKNNKSSDIFLTPEEEYKFDITGTEKLNNRPIIVGSGPAGLAVAYFLRLKGHKVVV